MFYQHFKGNYYFKIFTAKHCDNPKKEFAVYLALYWGDFKFGQPWIRSLNQFNDIHPTAEVKRLRKLSIKESLLLCLGVYWFQKLSKSTKKSINQG